MHLNLLTLSVLVLASYPLLEGLDVKDVSVEGLTTFSNLIYNSKNVKSLAKTLDFLGYTKSGKNEDRKLFKPGSVSNSLEYLITHYKQGMKVDEMTTEVIPRFHIILKEEMVCAQEINIIWRKFLKLTDLLDTLTTQRKRGAIEAKTYQEYVDKILVGWNYVSQKFNDFNRNITDREEELNSAYQLKKEIGKEVKKYNELGDDILEHEKFLEESAGLVFTYNDFAIEELLQVEDNFRISKLEELLEKYRHLEKLEQELEQNQKEDRMEELKMELEIMKTYDIPDFIEQNMVVLKDHGKSVMAHSVRVAKKQEELHNINSRIKETQKKWITQARQCESLGRQFKKLMTTAIAVKERDGQSNRVEL